MSLSPVTILRVFIPFAIGYFVSYIFRTVNAIIAPDLVRDIGIDPASLGLLTSAYFLSFAAFQLPLGLLLDRFGARRVEASLLIFAAAGAFIFARAETLTGLMIGRALIGLGVSACLMAAFKAFSLWLPPEKLPLAHGVQMVSGGLGALAATAPVELALKATDWRGVFLFLSGLTVVAAICVYVVVPEKRQTQAGESLAKQISGIREVFTSQRFWAIAPWAVTAQSAYLSIIGLWSGPWLRDIAYYSRMEIANTLMGVAIAMIAGYFILGALAERLARHGIPTMRVAACGMIAFLVVQGLLTLQWTEFTLALWLLFGFSGTACILPYAVLSQTFPKQLIGRVSTSLNLMVFLSAFASQWLIGWIIGLWPQTASGGYNSEGYIYGFGILIILQALSLVWYLVSTNRRKDHAR